MRHLLLIVSIGLGGSAMAQGLPVPPVPPANPPADEAAPVPNADAHPPAVRLTEGLSVNVRLYRAKSYDPSLGFAPGSRYQSTEDRKPIQTPGLSVSVPLK